MPGMKDFRNYLKKIPNKQNKFFEKHNGILLKVSSDNKDSLVFYSIKNITTLSNSYKSMITHKWAKRRVSIPGKTLNYNKNLHSILPNFVHRLDSLLILTVASQLLKQNITFSLSHDSIDLHLEDVQFTKECFFKIFKNKLLKEDVLKCFLLSNLKSSPELERILSNFEKERKKILDDIKSGKLVKNKFILK